MVKDLDIPFTQENCDKLGCSDLYQHYINLTGANSAMLSISGRTVEAVLHILFHIDGVNYIKFMNQIREN